MTKTLWYISKYANISIHGASTRQSFFCKEFAKQGFDVRLITNNQSHLFDTLPVFSGLHHSEVHDGYNVTWMKGLSYKNPHGLRRILSWVLFECSIILFSLLGKVKRPDVVIASSLSLFSVLSGVFFKFFFGSRFIFEVRDIWPRTLVDLKGMSKWHPVVIFFSFLESLGYRYSDAIVGSMPGLNSHVEEIAGLGRKVHFIPQGVDIDFFETKVPLSKIYVERYIPKDKFLIIYAGSMGHANALEYIVDAAKEINALDSSIHFLFVGKGGLKDALVKRAVEFSNISFAPAVSKENVQHLLSFADVLVASFKNESIYKFGMSLNKFVDYMYAGKPIVCMYSGLPSLINEANCGTFTEAEDVSAFVSEIIRYRNFDKEFLSALGFKGHKFLVGNRSYSSLGKKYSEIIYEAFS